MQLPTKPTKAESTEPNVLLIYAISKLGKTTVVSKLPDNLILDLENGTKYIDCMKVNIRNWNDFVNTVKALVAAKREGKKYKFITVDTISILEEWCDVHGAVIEHKKTVAGKDFDGQRITELPHGAGWAKKNAELLKWFTRLANLTDHLILVGHSSDKIINKGGEREVAAKDLEIQGKLANKICAFADAVAYLYRDEEDNSIIATFIPSTDTTSGTRVPNLAGTIVKLTDTNDSGRDTVYHWDKIFPDSVENNKADKQTDK